MKIGKYYYKALCNCANTSLAMGSPILLGVWLFSWLNPFLMVVVSFCCFALPPPLYGSASTPFRSRNGTLLFNQQNFSNIELAKPTNMTVPEISETVAAENDAQVKSIYHIK